MGESPSRSFCSTAFACVETTDFDSNLASLVACSNGSWTDLESCTSCHELGTRKKTFSCVLARKRLPDDPHAAMTRSATAAKPQRRPCVPICEVSLITDRMYNRSECKMGRIAHAGTYFAAPEGAMRVSGQLLTSRTLAGRRRCDAPGRGGSSGRTTRR